MSNDSPSNEIPFSDRDVVALLAEDQDVAWFLDANMILHANVRRIIGHNASLYVTPRVASEVRKRDENRGANQLLDSIESAGRVVNDAYYRDHLQNFRFLLHCCETLTPIARIYIKKMGAENFERAIQFSANEGTFFETEVDSPLVQQLQDNGILPENYISIHSKIEKSWFSYHAKRRAKLEKGEYIFADEELVAAASCNSLVMKKKTGILSNDRDLAAIIKNCRDNVLWVYSKGICIDRGYDVPTKAPEIFAQSCAWFQEYEQTESIRTGFEISPGQIPIYWENIDKLNCYFFSPFFVEFVSQAFPSELNQDSILKKLLDVFTDNHTDCSG